MKDRAIIISPPSRAAGGAAPRPSPALGSRVVAPALRLLVEVANLDGGVARQSGGASAVERG
jgi:hypothetical protein